MFAAYLEYEYFFAAAQLVLAMLGMGATLRLADFADVVREPKAFAVGLVSQLVLVPLIAFLFTLVVPLPAGVAVGLALVAAVPGGTMSNVATYLALGNTALSIALTAVSTLGCLATTPVVLRLLTTRSLPGRIEMPAAAIAFEIFVCLLAPLAAGMAIGALLPRRREAFTKWCIRACLLVILAMVIGASGAGRIDPLAYGWTGPLAVIGFSIVIQQASMALSRLCRLPRRDHVAVGIEVTIRNTNLALLIKASLLPVVAGVPDPVADGALFVALLYGGAAVFVVLPPCIVHRRLEAREMARRHASPPGVRAVAPAAPEEIRLGVEVD
jgi:BASS family bile acid:Na+ symporter